ncbi:hypothetical protein GEMRC1_009746 [Eukaryota sp. GEM-RC1]
MDIPSASGTWSLQQKHQFFRGLVLYGKNPIAIANRVFDKSPIQCASYLATLRTLEQLVDSQGVSPPSTTSEHSTSLENSILSQLVSSPITSSPPHSPSSHSPVSNDPEPNDVPSDTHSELANLMNIPTRPNQFIINQSQLLSIVQPPIEETSMGPLSAVVSFLEASTRQFIVSLVSSMFPILIEKNKRKKTEFILTRDDVYTTCCVLGLPIGLDLSSEDESEEVNRKRKSRENLHEPQEKTSRDSDSTSEEEEVLIE